MTTGLRIAWRLDGHGWADRTVTDHRAVVVLTASHITNAPQELLTASARLIAGETETRAQFEAEPTAARWIFYREDEHVRVAAHGASTSPAPNSKPSGGSGTSGGIREVPDRSRAGRAEGTDEAGEPARLRGR